MFILGAILTMFILSGLSAMAASALFEALVKRRVEGAWDE